VALASFGLAVVVPVELNLNEAATVVRKSLVKEEAESGATSDVRTSNVVCVCLAEGVERFGASEVVEYDVSSNAKAAFAPCDSRSGNALVVLAALDAELAVVEALVAREISADIAVVEVLVAFATQK
jgi:hypothetical protein